MSESLSDQLYKMLLCEWANTPVDPRMDDTGSAKRARAQILQDVDLARQRFADWTEHAIGCAALLPPSPLEPR